MTLRICIVDDDDVDRMALRRALDKAGLAATVDEAADRETALRILHPGGYDCIFLDYNIPGTDGLDLLRELRSSEIDTPVIILTGQGNEEIAVELMKAGAADYFQKRRLTPELLQQTVPPLVRGYRIQKELTETQERLRLAVAAADIGIWEYDVTSGRITASPRASSMLTLPATETHTPEEFFAATHLDDREKLRAAVDQTLDPSGTGEIELEYRIRDGGEIRWIQLRGRTVFRGTGARREPERVIGTALETTSRRRTEDALREAVQSRDDVLAIVSHDLRNPLTSILGSAQLLRETGSLDPELVASIETSCREMNSLIDDLLDAARIESGTLSIRAEPVDVGTVLSRVHQLFARSASEKNLELLVDGDPSHPALGDADRLVQALSNLVGNAIRVTESGSVRLSARNGDGVVSIDVTDTGPGIPADSLPRLFDRFWQARQSRRGGAGLGLAIVRGIVDAHDGTIDVESQEGTGTRFTITIPAADSRD